MTDQITSRLSLPLVQAAQDWFGQGSVQNQDDNAAPDSEMEPDA